MSRKIPTRLKCGWYRNGKKVSVRWWSEKNSQVQVSDIMRNFQAFNPSSIDTFAEVWYKKCYHYLRKSIRELRCGDRELAYRFLGMADAAVLVLYDVNDNRAYQAMQSFKRVNFIVGTYSKK